MGSVDTERAIIVGKRRTIIAHDLLYEADTEQHLRIGWMISQPTLALCERRIGLSGLACDGNPGKCGLPVSGIERQHMFKSEQCG